MTYMDVKTKLEQKDVDFKKRVKVPMFTVDTIGVETMVRIIEFAQSNLGRMPVPEEFNTYGMEILAKIRPEVDAELRDSTQVELVIGTALRDVSSALQLTTTWRMQFNTPDDRAAGNLIGLYFEHRLRTLADGQMAMAEPGDRTLIMSRLSSEVAAIYGQFTIDFEPQFPGGEFDQQPEDAFQPVGLKFVDYLLDGGLVKGEVVGHVASIGAGKTTLAYQVCWTRALQILDFVYRTHYQGASFDAVLDEMLARNDLPQIYFCVYETVPIIKANLISCAAMIDRKVALSVAFGQRNSGIRLSSAELQDYKPYEEKMYAEIFAINKERQLRGEGELLRPRAEKERMAYAVKIIERLLRIVDFSGYDQRLMNMACAGAKGLGTYIDIHQKRLNDPGVNFVVMDFVGAAIDMQARGKKLSENFRNSAVRQFPQEAQLEIAAKYRTPLWLAHQLNSTENKKKSGTIPEFSNAEGSGQFHMYCSVAFASGVLSKDNVAVFKPAKIRRRALSDINLQLARLSNQYAMWESAESYVVQDGAVINKSEAYSSDDFKGKFKGR